MPIATLRCVAWRWFLVTFFTRSARTSSTRPEASFDAADKASASKKASPPLPFRFAAASASDPISEDKVSGLKPASGTRVAPQPSTVITVLKPD
jgi:hypothetical protein